MTGSYPASSADESRLPELTWEQDGHHAQPLLTVLHLDRSVGTLRMYEKTTARGTADRDLQFLRSRAVARNSWLHSGARRMVDVLDGAGPWRCSSTLVERKMARRRH